MNELKIKAYENVINDIRKLVAKRRKKLEKAKESLVFVMINGEEYYNENEIQEAYGVGIITDSQRSKAIKELEYKNTDEEEQRIKEEIRILNMADDSLCDLREKEGGE